MWNVNHPDMIMYQLSSKKIGRNHIIALVNSCSAQHGVTTSSKIGWLRRNWLFVRLTHTMYSYLHVMLKEGQELHSIVCFRFHFICFLPGPKVNVTIRPTHLFTNGSAIVHFWVLFNFPFPCTIYNERENYSIRRELLYESNKFCGSAEQLLNEIGEWKLPLFLLDYMQPFAVVPQVLERQTISMPR